MDPVIAKLLDYGVLGMAVFVLGYLVYKLGQFIVRKFEETGARCETDRQLLSSKLDQKDTVIIQISEKCFKSIDENTRVTKELVSEIRQRRISDSTPKGNMQ